MIQKKEKWAWFRGLALGSDLRLRTMTTFHFSESAYWKVRECLPLSVTMVCFSTELLRIFHGGETLEANAYYWHSKAWITFWIIFVGLHPIFHTLCSHYIRLNLPFLLTNYYQFLSSWCTRYLSLCTCYLLSSHAQGAAFQLEWILCHLKVDH